MKIFKAIIVLAVAWVVGSLSVHAVVVRVQPLLHKGLPTIDPKRMDRICKRAASMLKDATGIELSFALQDARAVEDFFAERRRQVAPYSDDGIWDIRDTEIETFQDKIRKLCASGTTVSNSRLLPRKDGRLESDDDAILVQFVNQYLLGIELFSDLRDSDGDQVLRGIGRRELPSVGHWCLYLNAMDWQDDYIVYLTNVPLIETEADSITLSKIARGGLVNGVSFPSFRSAVVTYGSIVNEKFADLNLRMGELGVEDQDALLAYLIAQSAGGVLVAKWQFSDEASAGLMRRVQSLSAKEDFKEPHRLLVQKDQRKLDPDAANTFAKAAIRSDIFAAQNRWRDALKECEKATNLTPGQWEQIERRKLRAKKEIARGV